MGVLLPAVFLNSGFADSHYVSTNSPFPTPPYTNWETAATSIQDAIDTSETGDTVWVTNGTYCAITVDKAIALKSMNGPETTIIRGSTTNGEATGCATLSDGSLLDGFTLRDGHSTAYDHGDHYDGGGAYCTSTNVILTNCIITANFGDMAGGVYKGTLYNCMISENTATYYAGAGGTSRSILYYCVLAGNDGISGGGAQGGELHFCEIRDNSSYYWGGGTYGSVAYNCIYRGNFVSKLGGGAGYGSLYNCLITENTSADGGGGTYCVDLYNCTVINNTASNSLGGMYSGTACNTIIYYNHQSGDHEAWGDDLQNCCTPSSWDVSGAYFTNAPGFVSLNNPHLLAGSPCVNAGTNGDRLADAMDLDGMPRTNGPVDIGAYEYWSETKTGAISVVISASDRLTTTNTPLRFTVELDGQVDDCMWNFGDGLSTTGVFEVSHAFSQTGLYTVSVTAWNLDGAVTDSVNVRICGPDVFVSQDGNDDRDGYDWTRTKATIQSAIDSAWPGATRVLVSNGVYDTGGRVASESLTNRVLLDKGLTLQSVNGPEVTFIVGQAADGGSNGDDAVRGVYMSTGTCISGFTIMNGHTRRMYVENCIWSPKYGTTCYIKDETPGSGGGIWSCSSNNLVSHCVLLNNSAYLHGGGIVSARVENCSFISNSVEYDGGGAYGCTVSNCSFTGNNAGRCGGGAHSSDISNSLLTINSAGSFGGGVCVGTIEECTIASNVGRGGVYNCSVYNSDISFNSGEGTILGTMHNCRIYSNGVGMLDGTAYNCLIYGNAAEGARYATLNSCTIVNNGGWGASYCHCYNCIIVSNNAPTFTNWDGFYSDYSYVCTTPLPGGDGCITNDPCFVNYALHDYHLASNSPCIDAGGTNTATLTDLDRTPRFLDGNGDGIAACDIGAYEYVHPTADSDGDGLSDTNELFVWHTQALVKDSDGDDSWDGSEVTAGTDPLRAGSFFGMEQATHVGPGCLLTWRTVFGKGYWVQSTTNLNSDGWSNLWNYPIYELNEYPEGTESFYDQNAASNSSSFYRILLNQ